MLQRFVVGIFSLAPILLLSLWWSHTNPAQGDVLGAQTNELQILTHSQAQELLSQNSNSVTVIDLRVSTQEPLPSTFTPSRKIPLDELTQSDITSNSTSNLLFVDQNGSQQQQLQTQLTELNFGQTRLYYLQGGIHTWN